MLDDLYAAKLEELSTEIYENIKTKVWKTLVEKNLYKYGKYEHVSNKLTVIKDRC